MRYKYNFKKTYLLIFCWEISFYIIIKYFNCCLISFWYRFKFI
nr:MAG TPA: hypothetical protein [Crassvirales sp.]